MENTFTLFFIPLLVAVLVLFVEYLFVIPLINKHHQGEKGDNRISNSATANQNKSNASENQSQRLLNNENFKSSIKGAFLGAILSIISGFLLLQWKENVTSGYVLINTIFIIVPLSITGLIIGRNKKHFTWVLVGSIGFAVFFISFDTATGSEKLYDILVFGFPLGGFFVAITLAFSKLFVRVMKW